MQPSLRGFLVLICALSAGASGWRAMAVDIPALPGKDSASSQPDRQRLKTEIFSVRRSPDAVERAVTGAALLAEFEEFLGDTQGCISVSEGSLHIASRDDSDPFIPASTQKLLTAAAALDVLGPDYVFETRVVARSAPKDGHVGDIWVIGGGDPLLATPNYAAFIQEDPQRAETPLTLIDPLVTALGDAGVRAIDGDIFGDDYRYDDTRYVATWKSSYRTGGEIGPLGALTVNGGFSTSSNWNDPVTDPATFTAGAFSQLLINQGIPVSGGPTRGVAPQDGVEIASVTSAPLSEIVGSMLTGSDNLAAELLMREIGFIRGTKGSTQEGVRVATERLGALGVPMTGVHLVDGSGLDRGNTLTCDALIAVLERSSGPRLAAIDDGLAIAGETGTLAERFVDTDVAGNLRAKTGRLSGVAGLVGVVESGPPRRLPLRFAMLANDDFSDATGGDLQKWTAQILVSFAQEPIDPATAMDLVPVPE